jgi:hypothetical protein
MAADVSAAFPARDAVDDSRHQQMSDAISAIAERRAVIEQTKGMLMFLYGVDADAAFEMLRSQSQQHNVKLRLIAEQIMKDLVQLGGTGTPPSRTSSDGVIARAHQQIARVAAPQTDGESRTDGEKTPHQG